MKHRPVASGWRPVARATFTLALTPALLLALTACGSLVPPAGQPEAPLRDSFRTPPTGTPPLVAPTPGDTARTAHEWDGFFTDERLRQVVGLALADNRSLRASAAPCRLPRRLKRSSSQLLRFSPRV